MNFSEGISEGVAMKFDAFYIVCTILIVLVNIVTSDVLRELLFPRFPTLTRVRHISEDSERSIDERNAVLDTVGLIEKHGYPAEEHKVTTEDGYNIIFFRIPGSPHTFAKEGKPVVFLQHGIFASSDSWVLLGPEKDLAFILADAGYDVWIGNIRGNSYSRSHTDLSPQDPDFWDFSFHEVGMWDLPKMIDHVLERTKQKSLFYIGHSMGTTVGLILLSGRPEYNDKIRFFVAFAPIALWKGPPNPFVELMTVNGVAMKNFFDTHGIHELGPQTTNNVRIGRAFCNEHSATLSVCAEMFFLVAGYDPKQLNMSILSHITSYFPAGASTKTLDHYRQNILSGNFHPYDEGYNQNFKLYRKKKPPMYDLKKISAPTALIYGKNDLISREENAIELSKRLRNLVTLEAVPFELFNHLDFLWAINAKELLFDRAMELMSMYSSQR